MKMQCALTLFFMTMLATSAMAAMPPASAEPFTPVEEPQPITFEHTEATTIPEKQEDKYFAKDNPVLTDQEEEALAITKKLDKAAIKPVEGKNGSISYHFGNQQPSIVCAVLQVCDVTLQTGEKVNNVELGDTARWTVEPAVSGTGSGEIQHLIIKPMDVGLSTSLVVTTNWRTYHFKLRSHRKAYMPQVSFTYPDEAEKKWNAIKARDLLERREKTIPETGEYLGDLSFDYEIAGDAPWKPVRVYNDGHKTIIQMPSTMEQTEAPTLLVLRNERLFSEDETVMVNYRVQGDRYIVDSVFKKAILIAGVGKDQDRMTITWRKNQ
ncbi:MAG: P-type conjugative transfer protein TrbG [Pseudomonadota bacterium]